MRRRGIFTSLPYSPSRQAVRTPRQLVVGGSAIEIYTRGAYVSGDIDIVADQAQLAKILESWGFLHKNREWYHPEWKLAVDLVRNPEGYTGSRRLTRVIVTPYGDITLAAVEDLIVKRLASAKYRRIPTDFDHARLLVQKFGEDLDMDYLRSTATYAGVADALNELLSLTKSM